jgi:hypothetical protein
MCDALQKLLNIDSKLEDNGNKYLFCCEILKKINQLYLYVTDTPNLCKLYKNRLIQEKENQIMMLSAIALTMTNGAINLIQTQIIRLIMQSSTILRYKFIRLLVNNGVQFDDDINNNRWASCNNLLNFLKNTKKQILDLIFQIIGIQQAQIYIDNNIFAKFEIKIHILPPQTILLPNIICFNQEKLRNTISCLASKDELTNSTIIDELKLDTNFTVFEKQLIIFFVQYHNLIYNLNKIELLYLRSIMTQEKYNVQLLEMRHKKSIYIHNNNEILQHAGFQYIISLSKNPMIQKILNIVSRSDTSDGVRMIQIMEEIQLNYLTILQIIQSKNNTICSLQHIHNNSFNIKKNLTHED